jgi:hypothetical protein
MLYSPRDEDQVNVLFSLVISAIRSADGSQAVTPTRNLTPYQTPFPPGRAPMSTDVELAEALTAQSRRLLVAIDDSPSSQLALSMAVSIAQREHGTIMLVGVSPDLAWQTALDANAGVSPQEVQADADAEVQASLDTALAQVPPEIGAHSILRRGKVGPSRAGTYFTTPRQPCSWLTGPSTPNAAAPRRRGLHDPPADRNPTRCLMRALPARLRLGGTTPPTWLVDRFLQSYVLWRERCAEVAVTYESWAGAARSDRGAAFAAYRAALDREDGAARVHQQYATRVGDSVPAPSRQ